MFTFVHRKDIPSAWIQVSARRCCSMYDPPLEVSHLFLNRKLIQDLAAALLLPILVLLPILLMLPILLLLPYCYCCWISIHTNNEKISFPEMILKALLEMQKCEMNCLKNQKAQMHWLYCWKTWKLKCKIVRTGSWTALPNEAENWNTLL